MKYFIALIIAGFISGAYAEAVKSSFPSDFKGVWDANPEQCLKRFSTARVTISDNIIEYWESTGEISKVIYQTESSIKVNLAMSGEEERWSVISIFILTEQDILVDVFENGQAFSRVRCGNET